MFGQLKSRAKNKFEDKNKAVAGDTEDTLENVEEEQANVTSTLESDKKNSTNERLSFLSQTGGVFDKADETANHATHSPAIDDPLPTKKHRSGRPSRLAPSLPSSPEITTSNKAQAPEPANMVETTSSLVTGDRRVTEDISTTGTPDHLVESLQRQNRMLLKQIMAMKRQQHHQLSASSSSPEQLSKQLSPRSLGVALTSWHSGTGSSNDDSVTKSTFLSSSIPDVVERLKNQLALSELKLKRANKNFHDLSKRTRDLETENGRAERNLLDLSSRLKVANDATSSAEAKLANLENCISDHKQDLRNLAAAQADQREERAEMFESNKMLVLHARMCEQRIQSAEAQLARSQNELASALDTGLQWKNDRRDIGKYALSLEEGLKRAHAVIQTLTQENQRLSRQWTHHISTCGKPLLAGNKRNEHVEESVVSPQRPLLNVIDNLAENPTLSELSSAMINDARPPELTLENVLSETTNPSSPKAPFVRPSAMPITSSPSVFSLSRDSNHMPPPPKVDEDLALPSTIPTTHPPPPRSSPVTQEFFG